MSHFALSLLAWLSAAALIVVASSQAAAQQHRVPDGFVIEKVAGAPDVVFPMFACFDDRGRLFVAESSGEDLYAAMQQQTRRCRIRLLEDRGLDGRFRKSRVFADHLNFPMGLAWRDGKLYVADPPDLVVLQDAKGEGRAGRRTVLLSGFGHTDNGSLHGLLFGPDGLLYMTMGSPDGYKLRRKDGTLLEGQSGALIRCRPDGSEPEVICRGFVNLVEVAFTARGEAVGTDNWFRNVNGKVSSGLRDALVHLVDGGLYPSHPDVGTPQPVTGDPLRPISLFPAVALSGLTVYRGSAFPAEIQGQVFSAQHNARKVGRHVLVPAGSTFHSQDFDFVTTDDADFHPSDVVEDADGSLLVIDTGSWYIHHCPTGQIRHTKATGGIYRVRWNKAAPVDDPWGSQIDWNHASGEQLVQLLGDPRPAVQDRARLWLASRGKAAVPALAAVLDGRTAVSVQQHAVWALAALADASAVPPLRRALGSAHPDVVAPAAHALALRADRQSADTLGRLLGSDSPVVQMAAAEALARCGDEKTVPLLWKALQGKPDRFLEHALIHAVHCLATTAVLHAALEHRHPRVQKAALLLLDQPPRPRGALAQEVVIARVSASDPELRKAALSILQQHPEWAEQAAGLVHRWLEKPALSAEEQTGLRTLLLAFQGRPSIQDVVTEVLANKSATPAERQVLVLETLAQTSLPEMPAAWAAGLAGSIRSPDRAVRRQAVRTAAMLQVPQLDDALTGLANRNEEPVELRLEALRGVILRRPTLSAPVFELLLGQLDENVSPLTRLAAAEVLGRSRLSDAQMVRLLKVARDDALASPAVLLPALQRSVTAETAAGLLDYLAASLRQSWRPAETDLNRVLAALPAPVRDGAEAGLQTTPQRLRELWRQGVEQQRARLAEFEPLLTGGSPERGRKVFSSQKVACATCHRIGSEGGQIGPDLTRIGGIRAGRDILESIVFPSSTIAQGYESYLVTLNDGRSVTGVLTRSTGDTLVLRDSSGAEWRLRKDQVDVMTRSATSLMPEGLDQALTRDELRDLLGFLQGLK